MDTYITALNKNGFIAKSFATGSEAASYLLTLIAPDSSVGIGGSLTARQLGLSEKLRGSGHEVIWHWEHAPEQMDAARVRANAAPYYISSANAITKDGQIVNIDGSGNRVSAIGYGDKTVIVIAGVNKLANDLSDAINMVKNVSAPANAVRLNLSTPCTVTGKCEDCDSPQRICKITSILERKPGGVRDFYVLLVNEHLGK